MCVGNNHAHLKGLSISFAVSHFSSLFLHALYAMITIALPRITYKNYLHEKSLRGFHSFADEVYKHMVA